MNLSTAVALAPILPEYQRLRQQGKPALKVFHYLRDDQGLSYEQFACAHEFNSPEEWERSYCVWCGLDGDM